VCLKFFVAIYVKFVVIPQDEYIVRWLLCVRSSVRASGQSFFMIWSRPNLVWTFLGDTKHHSVSALTIWVTGALSQMPYGFLVVEEDLDKACMGVFGIRVARRIEWGTFFEFFQAIQRCCKCAGPTRGQRVISALNRDRRAHRGRFGIGATTCVF